MRLTANRIAGILREHGYKLTPQRHIVLKVIASSNDLLTPDSILEKSQLEDPHIGRVTVYRTLEVLSKLSLVCRGPFGGQVRELHDEEAHGTSPSPGMLRLRQSRRYYKLQSYRYGEEAVSGKRI